jgi:hypothetical protein
MDDKKIVNTIIKLSGDENKLRDFCKKEVYPLGLKKSQRLISKAFMKLK